MARFTFPTCARRIDFPTEGSGGTFAHFLAAPLRQQGELLLDLLNSTSYRGAPLYPGADQIARNLRRPSSDCHRERSAIQGTGRPQRGIARGAGAADGDERKCSASSASSPTDVQPVLDAIVESAARVCGIDDVLLRLREGEYLGSAGALRSHTHCVAATISMRSAAVSLAALSTGPFTFLISWRRRTISEDRNSTMAGELVGRSSAARR